MKNSHCFMPRNASDIAVVFLEDFYSRSGPVLANCVETDKSTSLSNIYQTDCTPTQPSL